MYKIVTVEDKIRVPPSKFKLKLQDAVKRSLEDIWLSLVEKEIGMILAVVSIDKIGEGKIYPGDGAIHYEVMFKILVYHPELHEIIKGNVIDVTEFGVFVRMGPVDGMVHVSQLMDDFVSYDQKNGIFVGRESKRTLKEGDAVKSRVISVSMENKQYKIGLTTRQYGLGVPGWAKLVAERAKRPAAPAAKEGRKGGQPRK